MKKIKGVVYCVTNTRNGKKYVGISIRGVKRRWTRHVRDARNGSNHLLHRAIRKYGADAFTVHVLARSDDWGQLCQLEQHYIAKLKTHARYGGYNCTAGGDGVVDPTDEECARRSEWAKRLHADPEFRMKNIEKAKRQWQDEEFRAKMSEMSKRLNADPGFAARRDARMRRRWTDEEFRAKMSEVRRMTNKRLLAEGWRGERTAFNDFCREHGLDGRNVRQRLRRRGIYGLKDINDPRVREVLDEMIAKLAHEKATSIMTLH